MMLRGQEAAEDAVQEAALKSWRKLAKLRVGTDPRPWLLIYLGSAALRASFPEPRGLCAF
jgi:DNA-directed RNA polymerase specialized sigma24 family protein